MKIAFLDRDGVINLEVNYLYKIEDFKFAPNSISGMKKLIANGYQIIVVTNQAGIARGFYTENEYQKLTAWYRQELENEGVNILDVFHCPHHPAGIVPEFSIECQCRKPNSGMLDLAAKKYDISKSESMLIGDKESDILAGLAFGLSKLYMVETGHLVSDKDKMKYNVYSDLTNIPL
ncbi:D,D-heptose 1,7-bisphosphate phosphatase 2 [Vibrio coralliirubri]|uniref:D-glycero-alpha-D-manno-heptose-1,7-bisphosphate 7-phosphatase n=1 Tax=Vibrio coralliirubri TaxID=1516159 RepID=UPI00062E96D3|nr:HAD family hydrolase [Vibrio coralliirubri]CDT93209.1 D,D-heptose 1,7-bisphosphate phosphatase 2 [Vibrio coralliirubri]